MLSSKEIRRFLHLEPHPEGGAFCEVYRSSTTLHHPFLGNNGDGLRAAVTTIYFLLEKRDFSAWHKVCSDEIWCLVAGGPLELHTLTPEGEYEFKRLGRRFSEGEAPHAVIPADHWQAACSSEGADFSLAVCIVAPGFDFADFTMLDRKDLEEIFPQHADLITAFTRR